MTHLSAISTTLPKYHASNKDVLDAAAIWLKDSPTEFELYKRFLSSSKTESRYFVVPPKEIVALGGSGMRAELFEREAKLLATKAVEGAFKASKVSPSEIDALIFTSCSCPLIPALDTYLVDTFELPRSLVRIPSYQFGCAGGIIGLGLSNRFKSTLKNTLLVSAELCSLVFQSTNRTPSNLVGAAIFGDGAAAAILSSDDAAGFTIIDQQSYLLPETRHLMGYDIKDSGPHLRLDKELPSALVKAIPNLVDQFLSKNQLNRAAVPWWLFHPGGTKILTFLDEILELTPERSHWAGDILHTVGNLSSATILFVLEHFVKSKTAQSGDHVLLLGVGPGLTIELVLGQMS